MLEKSDGTFRGTIHIPALGEYTIRALGYDAAYTAADKNLNYSGIKTLTIDASVVSSGITILTQPTNTPSSLPAQFELYTGSTRHTLLGSRRLVKQEAGSVAITFNELQGTNENGSFQFEGGVSSGDEPAMFDVYLTARLNPSTNPLTDDFLYLGSGNVGGTAEQAIDLSAQTDWELRFKARAQDYLASNKVKVLVSDKPFGQGNAIAEIFLYLADHWKTYTITQADLLQANDESDWDSWTYIQFYNTDTVASLGLDLDAMYLYYSGEALSLPFTDFDFSHTLTFEPPVAESNDLDWTNVDLSSSGSAVADQIIYGWEFSRGAVASNTPYIAIEPGTAGTENENRSLFFNLATEGGFLLAPPLQPGFTSLSFNARRNNLGAGTLYVEASPNKTDWTILREINVATELAHASILDNTLTNTITVDLTAAYDSDLSNGLYIRWRSGVTAGNAQIDNVQFVVGP